MESKIYLSIGSNSGDRRAFIAKAVDELGRLGRVRVSRPYESEPEGFESANSFVNVAVELTVERQEQWSEADALGLLECMQGIERRISAMPHRNADGSYRDREIDIDIISIEGFAMTSPRLTIPHPRAASRAFVMEPLHELLGL